MWRIHIDVPVTRRKRFHGVTDADGEDLYAARTVTEALHWCCQEGESGVRLVARDREFIVIEVPAITQEEP